MDFIRRHDLEAMQRQSFAPLLLEQLVHNTHIKIQYDINNKIQSDLNACALFGISQVIFNNVIYCIFC